MNSLKAEIYEKLLHKWLEDKKIPHIRSGMVDDVEQFILDVLQQLEAHKIAERMSKQATGDDNEQKDS